MKTTWETGTHSLDWDGRKWNCLLMAVPNSSGNCSGRHTQRWRLQNHSSLSLKLISCQRVIPRQKKIFFAGVKSRIFLKFFKKIFPYLSDFLAKRTMFAENLGIFKKYSKVITNFNQFSNQMILFRSLAHKAQTRVCEISHLEISHLVKCRSPGYIYHWNKMGKGLLFLKINYN